MNVKVIVHGVFNEGGQQFWNAMQDDKNALATFYSGKRPSSAHTSLIVERKSINGKTHILYTYLRMGQFLDRQGQMSNNGYFAITLLIEDDYYKDVVNIYNVLDEAFRKYILPGTIETRQTSDGKYVFKYRINGFDKISSILNDMSKNIESYLTNFSDISDLLTINQTGTVATTSMEEINIIDFKEIEGLSLLKNGKSFSVSPLYNTKQTEEKVSKVNQELQKEKVKNNDLLMNLSNASSKCASLDSEKRTLQKDLDRVRDELADFRKSSSSNQAELNGCKEKLKHYEAIISEFMCKFQSLPLNPVCTPTPHHTPDIPTKRHIDWMKIIKWSAIVLSIAIIAVMVWWFFGPDPKING